MIEINKQDYELAVSEANHSQLLTMFEKLKEENLALKAQVEQLQKKLFVLITDIEWHHTKTAFMPLSLVNKAKEMKGEA